MFVFLVSTEWIEVVAVKHNFNLKIYFLFFGFFFFPILTCVLPAYMLIIMLRLQAVFFSYKYIYIYEKWEREEKERERERRKNCSSESGKLLLEKRRACSRESKTRDDRFLRAVSSSVVFRLKHYLCSLLSFGRITLSFLQERKKTIFKNDMDTWKEKYCWINRWNKEEKLFVYIDKSLL